MFGFPRKPPELDDELIAFGRGDGPPRYDRDGTLYASLLRRMWLSPFAADSTTDVHAFRAFAALDRGDFESARKEIAASGRPALAKLLERGNVPATVDAEMRKRASKQRVEVSDSFRTCPSSVVRCVHEAAAIRDHARAVGDIEQVARWQGIVDRHVAQFATFEQRLMLALIVTYF